MKVKCSIIEDLLPLYLDGVCSDDSKGMVEEHLKECGLCREKLEVQKSEIIVDENLIKENLKAKEPFKKIKKSWLIRFILILVSIPFLYLSLIEFGGDGVGFSALLGRYKAEQFLDCVEKGSFDKATHYMSFAGGKYQTIGNKDEAKRQWVLGMQKLKSEGIEIVSHEKNEIKTDDTFTSGYVIVTVKYKEQTYKFRLWISTNTWKVEPGRLDPSLNFNTPPKEPTEVENMLMKKISEVISTYFPG